MISTFQIGSVEYKVAQNVYIIHVGFSRLKYFKCEEKLEIHEKVVYDTELDLSIAEMLDVLDNSSLYKLETNEVRFIEKLSNYKYVGFKPRYCTASFSDDKTKPDKIIVKLESFYNKEDKFYYNLWIRKNDYIFIPELNIASQLLLKKEFYTFEQAYPSKDNLFNAFEKAKRKIDSINLTELIDCLKVKIVRISYTQRGSDNYINDSAYIKSEYQYMDNYLENLFPTIDTKIYEYSERTGDEYISDKYPDKDKWDEEASKLESEYKVLSYGALRNYDRERHILTLAFEELSCLSMKCEEERQAYTRCCLKYNLCWNDTRYKPVLRKLYLAPDNYQTIIQSHNETIDSLQVDQYLE